MLHAAVVSTSSAAAQLCCWLRCAAGAILTKMDGDSRGGAALSVREVSSSSTSTSSTSNSFL
jgi:signal recognition particle GTPase